MKRMLYVISCVVILGALFAFDQQKSPGQEEAVAIGIEMKVDQFIRKQRSDCRIKAIIIAEQRVDSLMRVWSRNQEIDTLSKPPRPGKPDMPPIRNLPDSLNHDILKEKKKQ